MVLEIKTYNQKELAEWFGITYNTFRMSKDKKLEELKDYAEFNIIKSKSGRISGIQITEIYCPIYYKSNKEDFISFLSHPKNWENTLDQGYGNISIVVNYYCKLKGISYRGLGPRVTEIKVDGISYDSKFKISEVKKRRNTDAYKEWYYLYSIAKKFFKQQRWIDSNDSVLCRSDDYYPIYLKVSTKEMNETAEAIRRKYFGIRTNEEMEKIVDIIYKEVDGEAKVAVLRKALLEVDIIKRMTDEEKRLACEGELANAGLLPREGYRMGTDIIIDFEKDNKRQIKLIEPEEGEFEFEFE